MMYKFVLNLRKLARRELRTNHIWVEKGFVHSVVVKEGRVSNMAKKCGDFNMC